ncbi:hypothetical protein [Thiobacillus denitrificans]|uniref:hypothetical protein n=1 Tax=Thiobacillus denitrificans TaxID=36861 RepID=UPI0012FBF141|nr:hypothetical protein [Thiobacillus denitrificans]
MDLKDFVSETLQQIVEGVKAAQDSVQQSGASINPNLLGDYKEHAKHGLLLSGTGKVAQLVQFDVALEVKEDTGTKGGIGVVAGVFALGSQGQSNTENSSLSRVKFCIPLSLA